MILHFYCFHFYVNTEINLCMWFKFIYLHMYSQAYLICLYIIDRKEFILPSDYKTLFKKIQSLSFSLIVCLLMCSKSSLVSPFSFLRDWLKVETLQVTFHQANGNKSCLIHSLESIKRVTSEYLTFLF